MVTDGAAMDIFLVALSVSGGNAAQFNPANPEFRDDSFG
jgi:hypothetical protein